METNLYGMLSVSQAFAPILKKNGGGALVNMLSALSWISLPSTSAYSVTKAAAWALSNGLRNELRGQGTQVVSVHAGYIDTDMVKSVDARSRARRRSPPPWSPGSRRATTKCFPTRPPAR